MISSTIKNIKFYISGVGLYSYLSSGIAFKYFKVNYFPLSKSEIKSHAITGSSGLDCPNEINGIKIRVSSLFFKLNNLWLTIANIIKPKKGDMHLI